MLRNIRPADFMRRFLRTDNKAVALIIVIFAMMIFAVLGWTLTAMQSTDFEANLRNYDSERTLSYAEAGAQWALNQLSLNTAWRTGNGDSDCNDNGDWLAPHTLSTGQYSICCREPTASETGNAVIESRGYIPSQAVYRSRREVKVEVTLGTFDKTLIAKNLFDWTLTHAGTRVNGIAQALYYDRNGNCNPTDGTNCNEPGVDYDPLPAPVLPADGSGDDRLVAASPFPTINMSYYETQAGARNWQPPRTAVITGISEVGGRSRLQLDTSIFSNPPSQWDDAALRNITRGTWLAGNWLEIRNVVGGGGDRVDLDGIVDWSVGDRVNVVPRIFTATPGTDGDGKYYDITFSCDYFTSPWNQWEDEGLKNFTRGTWGYDDWGVIQTVTDARNARVRVDDAADLGTPWIGGASGDWLGTIRRYRDNVTSPNPGYVWYIKSDVLFDLRDNQSWEPGPDGTPENITFRRTGLVVEGDVGIKGENDLNMTERPWIYPNLATKNGNIISLDTPAGSTENQRRQRRNFDDLVYSENGTVYFNYLDAKAVYGNDITFDGQVRVNYDGDLTRLTGFTWGLSNMKWKEQ